MRAIISPLEMHHAVKTSERCSVALIAVWVEFLLCEDVTTSLDHLQHDSQWIGYGIVWCRVYRLTSHEKDTIVNVCGP